MPPRPRARLALGRLAHRLAHRLAQRVAWTFWALGVTASLPAEAKSPAEGVSESAAKGSSSKKASKKASKDTSKRSSKRTTEVQTESTEASPDADASSRRLIEHRVVPHERLEDIAERYGVTKEEIFRTNPKLHHKAYLHAGRVLKVRARRFPPPRQKIQFTVRKGDTWDKIATQHHVRVKDLRKWNPTMPKALRSGVKVVVYTNPPEPPRLSNDADSDELAAKIPAGGYSHGRPNRGRLIGGIALPKSDDYDIQRPENAFGTTKTIRLLVEVLAKFRRETGFRGTIPIGAISKQGGGRLRPHSSHQSGRDIDVGLPRIPGLGPREVPSIDEIDWAATWQLALAFAKTGEIEYIFLDKRRIRKLHQVARQMGATESELDLMFAFRHGEKGRRGLIRYSEGHVVHMHVRVKCENGVPSCESY